MSVKKEAVEKAGGKPERVARKRIKGPRGKVLTANAGIFKLMGIAESGVPGGYSWRKHELSDCGQ